MGKQCASKEIAIWLLSSTHPHMALKTLVMLLQFCQCPSQGRSLQPANAVLLIHSVFMWAPTCSSSCCRWRLPGAKTAFQQENETPSFLPLGELLMRSVSQCKMLGGKTQAGVGRCGDAGRAHPRSCRELLSKGGN